nr:hypothetical protein [Micromonospora sp. DSM 115978]
MAVIASTRTGEVVADLSGIPREVRRGLRPALQQTGEAVAQDARRRASWSRRIPGAIRVKVLYGKRTQGVVVTVARRRAPHARPFEGIGGRRSGSAATFRHPLFGNAQRWYTQATRPFLHPAAQAKAAVTRRLVVRVVDDAARAHGFR